MKILVTGGAGFIGSNLVNELIEKNYKVAIVDNLSTGTEENINPKAKFYQSDITNKEELKKIFRETQPEKIIHAAAHADVINSVKNPVLDAQNNILGSLNLLECCKTYKIKKIIYLCTGGALYGNPEYLPADESHPIKPISPYGASKHAVELYLYMYKTNYDLDFTSLRFSNVYGIKEDINSTRVVPSFIKQFLSNKPPKITGDGKQGRDFIYVSDVVSAILKALEISTPDFFFNIGTEKVIPINEIYNTLKELLNSPSSPEYIPSRTGEVQQIYLKAQKARDQLGWQPQVELKAGLKRTLDYFKVLRSNKNQ
jgi:UDP-glucose 4-epimerase